MPNPACLVPFLFSIPETQFSVPEESTIELSIIITQSAAGIEALQRLLGQIPRACARLPEGTRWEVLICSPNANPDSLATLAKESGATALPYTAGYGAALAAAVAAARGRFILTMQPGLAHSPFIIPKLYAHRHEADVIIASRLIGTGYSKVNPVRRFLTWLGNKVFSRILDLPVRDLTSDYRLYNRRVFAEAPVASKGFDALLETLVKAYARGFHLMEIPFHYFPLEHSVTSNFLQVASSTFRELFALWRLRNGIECADYDERAFRSRVWFQRSWQRRRYNALVRMARECATILDVGCGSSQVLEGLPQADACDIRMNKLRYKREPGRLMVHASVFDLPFPTNSYDAVIFSQVIEHLPRDPRILQEIIRTTKPGGYVIVGTPDYATWWTTIERIYGFVHPDGYADEHITHYTFETLKQEVESYGCTFLEHAYVWHAELIMKFRKNP
ncbi:MAG: methyltransferase domain-containing protein [Candidatus Sumerlaeaceae bacterium]|nr:methyltransferase domain-containing protein [Candidatus Sumerlaeaceae bacterium]